MTEIYTEVAWQFNYLRSDLASDRKKNLECNKIESICVELYVNNKKWLITGMYRPPINVR